MSHNLIRLDVQHRLGQAHTRSMTTPAFPYFSPCLYLSFSQSFDVRVFVCVLNFYDFIIPYFKPFLSIVLLSPI